MSRFSIRRPLVLWLLLLLLALLLFSRLSGQLSDRVNQEGLSMAEKSIRRAAVQCYALEGAYPADYAYLSEQYGVSVDLERYFVDYQYTASNLMPDITVLPLS
jgi:hypothetical protein